MRSLHAANNVAQRQTCRCPAPKRSWRAACRCDKLESCTSPDSDLPGRTTPPTLSLLQPVCPLMRSRSSLWLTLARWAKVQRRWHARRGRVAVAGVMLSCYMLVLFGVPLPGPLAATNPSQPYPCQDSVCGCSSAEQCWRSCCCYTDPEKLAWAKRNNVTPPDDFLEQLTSCELAATVPLPQSCCASGKPEHSPQASVAVAGSCASREGTGKTPSSCKVDDGEPKTANSSRIVVTIEALKCRGLGTDWIGLHDVIPAVPFQICERSPLTADAAFPAWNGLPEISFPPPSPPPRGSFILI